MVKSWSGSPSFPRKLLGHCKTPFNKQKSPCSPKGTRTERQISAVPPCLPQIAATSITVPTHRLPVNAGIASEDTLGCPISPCPQRPICCPALRSALSPRNSLWMRLQLYFRLNGLFYDMPFIHQMCAFVKNFFSPPADKNQYSRTTPRTMPMISA